MHRNVALALLTLLVFGEELAHAEAASEEPQEVVAEESSEHFVPRLDSQYFWDEGAIPFIYVSAAVAVNMRLSVAPRSTPLFFSGSEGGRPVKGDTVPSYAVALYAGVGAGFLALTPSQARLHHFKGYAEAVLTTLALTEVAKVSFGRHRPDYQAGDTALGQRQSFISGHASITAATSLYLGLYFHEHLSERLGGPNAELGRTMVYASLAGIALGVPITRVNDNRHHVGDVVVGSAIGGAMAAVFFAYHEARFERDREGLTKKKAIPIVVLPDLQNPGFTLATRW